MIQTITDIMALLSGIHNVAINRGRQVYARAIAPAFVIFILLFFIGLGLNLTGAKGFNLLISLALILTTLFFSLRAEAIINIFFAGIISGIAQTPQTMPEEIKKFFQWYIGLIGQIMLWASVVFFFLGTLDARGNVVNIIGILAAVVVISLIQAVWKIGKPWGKKFVYFYVCLMLCLFIFRFVSVFIAGESNEGILMDISGFIKTKYQSFFQNKTTRQIPAGTVIYDYANGILKPASLKYDKLVSGISLNETVKQNGAIYEKFGLPDPTTGQPGAIVGWIFSGDLKDVSPEPPPPPTSTEKKVPNEYGDRVKELSDLGIIM